MASNGIRHNKKRNVGLVYELLVREMAARMVDKDTPGFKRAYGIARKYFSPGRPLDQELALFDAIRSARGMRPAAVRRVLGEVTATARLSDSRLIEIKKSNLIKDINYTLGRDFWDRHRIPEYRAIASIQVLIDSARAPKRLEESAQRAQLEESLVGFVSSSGPPTGIKVDREIDDLVCAVLEQKFNERYGSLMPRQKKLLERYVRGVVADDMRDVQLAAKVERGEMLRTMNESLTTAIVKSDPVMKERMEKAIDGLREIGDGPLTEDAMGELLLYGRLVEELRSDG